jgi:hypothetical protein
MTRGKALREALRARRAAIGSVKGRIGVLLVSCTVCCEVAGKDAGYDGDRG